MYSPEQIDPEPTKGKRSDRLYRRVTLAEDYRRPGLVRYEPELEHQVSDVRVYIAAHLNLEERKSSEKVLEGRLLHWAYPVVIPLPKR